MNKIFDIAYEIRSYYNGLMNDSFYKEVQKDKRESNGNYKEKEEFLLKEVGKDKVVLDIACNDGYFGSLLIERGNTVHGVDIASDNLKIAAKKGIKVKYVNVETEDLPYKDNTFDAVFLGDIIEHIFDTDRFLRECRRVLKKKGKLIITTPNVASFGRRMMLLLGISPFLETSTELPVNGLPSVGHVRYYTANTLRNQLRHNRFSSIYIRGNSLGLYYFTIPFFGPYIPSICTHLMCVAKK